MPGLLAWRLLLLLLAPKVDAGQLQIIAPFTQAMDKLWDDPLFPAQNHTMPTFQTHNFGCNITMLASLHASTGVPGVLSLEACGAIDSIGVWDYASALTRKNQTGLHPAWRENLDRLLDNTIPLFHTNPQILAGVFMGDEVLCDFVPFSNYSAVGEVVRKRLGAAGFIYGNECFRPFQDVGEVFSVGTTLPSFLNFISVRLLLMTLLLTLLACCSHLICHPFVRLCLSGGLVRTMHPRCSRLARRQPTF